MLEELKQAVWEANRELPRLGLVLFTWGNVSGVDRQLGLVVIKPSGVSYDGLTPQDMAVVELETGRALAGSPNPSSDTKTHLALYRAYPQLGGVVHTHSTCAVAWAQAGLDLPCLGTTHADCFHGPVPCTRGLTAQEVEADYEGNTGLVIVETLRERGIAPEEMPGVLCRGHGPFAWGDTPADAVYHAATLEQTARMALLSRMLCPDAAPLPEWVLEKHYRRKHGPDAYYGQKKQG